MLIKREQLIKAAECVKDAPVGSVYSLDNIVKGGTDNEEVRLLNVHTREHYELTKIGKVKPYDS